MKVKNRIFLDAVGLILSIVMVCIPGNSLVMRIFGVCFVFLYAWNIYDHYRELKKE